MRRRIRFGVILLALIGFGVVIPILPFLSPRLGADKFDIALIVVTFAACAGVAAPIWGRLSDRIGRKPVIMICLAGGALSYLCLAYATSLWMIFAARGFAGLMAGNAGVASAMMADITPPEERARGMGIIGAAFGLGLVLGPFLGGLLSGDSGNFTLPCLAACCLSLLAIGSAAVFLPESLTAERRAAQQAMHDAAAGESTYAMLKRTGNRLLVAQYVVHTSCVSSITYMVPLWMGDLLGWGARDVGILFGVQGGIMAILQGLLIGRLTAAIGELPLLRIGISCLCAGLLVALVAASAPVMVGATYLAISGATLCMPLLNALVSQRTPGAFRGRVLGTTSAAAAWGRVTGPLITGFTLSMLGYTAAWAGCLVIAGAYLWWAFAGSEAG